MRKKSGKYVYWGSLSLCYLLMVVAVFALLSELEREERRDDQTALTAMSHSHDIQAFFDSVDDNEKLTGVLLPLGPDDGTLPGNSSVWDVLRGVVAEEKDISGFDGVQVVKNVSDLTRGAIAELFLSGRPRSVFPMGDLLLMLNSDGTLLRIDCKNPRSPKLLEPMPYPLVDQVMMKGHLGYLLLKNSETIVKQIAVVDFSNPLEPLEKVRFNLDTETKAFFFSGSQIVTYGNLNANKSRNFLSLYDVTDDFRVIKVGLVPAPWLDESFVRYGQYLLVPDMRNGLRIYDFSDPLRPVLVSSLRLSGHVSKLMRRGEMIFGHGENDVLYIVSLAEIESPELVLTIKGAGLFSHFIARGDYSYYFSANGYLHVFDTPLAVAMESQEGTKDGFVADGLIPVTSDPRFVSLRKLEMGKKEGAAGAILPHVSDVVDSLFWKDTLALLDSKDTVHLYRFFGEALASEGTFELSPGRRWLAAGGASLYVGGADMVETVARTDEGSFDTSGQIEMAAEQSWDGAVLNGVLYVAAGEQGVLAFPLDGREGLGVPRRLKIPRQLHALVDARQLSLTDDNRIFVAAGRAGVLIAERDAGGRERLAGQIGFAEPVIAVEVMRDVCLASTGKAVQVVDIRGQGAMQHLGEISFSDVSRLAVVSDDLWAGYADGRGWKTMASPRFFDKEGLGALKGDCCRPDDKHLRRYRLVLFNDLHVIPAPGIVALSPLIEAKDADGEHAVN